MRYLIALAVLIGFAATASAEQVSDATANFLSSGAVSAIKASAKRSSATTEQKECVDSISKSTLVPLYKKVIASRLSQDDVASLEGFYSSPLGVRFAAALHAKRDPADAFSPAEISQLSSLLKTLPYQELLKATSSQDPEIAEKEKAIIKPLLNACLGAV